VDPEDVGKLVHRAVEGDPRAWRELVEAFQGLVWSVARSFRLSRADADDVAQTTWEKFARSIGGLQEPRAAGSWLATTARREALRVVEIRARTKPVGDLAWLASAWTDDTTPERIVVAREDDAARAAFRRQVWRSLGRLPEGCQQLLRLLAATPQLSYTEIAAALARPIGYIGPTRRRCLDKLREIL
jgi:RNA polymerase sigma factor (sigma-70 family)